MSSRNSYSVVLRRFFTPLLTGFTAKRRSLFFNDLRRYVASGVSYYDAITTMRRYCRNGHLKRVLDKMLAMVNAGRGICDALSLFPATFSEFELAMVDLGESTGKLEVALANVSEKLKSDYKIKQQVIRGLVWYVITAVFVVCVSILLQNMGHPTPVRITLLRLIAAMVLIVGIILGVKLIRATPGLGEAFDAVTCAIPFLGNVRKKAALARFATAFSYAYASGSDIQKTLRLAGESSMNRLFAADARRIASDVRRGDSLAEAFDRSRIMPPLLKQTVAMGEKTGDFDQAMMNITDFAKDELKTASEMIIQFSIALTFLTLAVYVFFLALGFYSGYLNKGLEIMKRANPHSHQ
ncbi:MAG TPA: type II secretion system F family protein [bacterium]|nr:type II secretion system F family protein [bacterium]